LFGLSTRVIHKGLRASGSGFNVNHLTSPATFRQACDTSLYFPAFQLGNASVGQTFHAFCNFCAIHISFAPVSATLATNSVSHGRTPTIQPKTNLSRNRVRGCSRMFAGCSWTFVDVRGRAWTFAEHVADVRGCSWKRQNCLATVNGRVRSGINQNYSGSTQMKPKNVKSDPNHMLNAQTRTISSAHCLLSSKLIALCEFSPCCLVCPPIPIKPTSNMSISHQTDSHMHTVVVHAIFNSTCRCCQSCMFRRADSAVGQGPRATLTQRKLIYKNCLIRSANFLMSALKFAP